jgi:hypothetical protein
VTEHLALRLLRVDADRRGGAVAVELLDQQVHRERGAADRTGGQQPHLHERGTDGIDVGERPGRGLTAVVRGP